jgi:RNA polymerase sigma factor (TIGR02999 family)
MSDVTRILELIEAGDASLTDELLPIVYDQLRYLARRQLAGEPPDISLQTADLIHEAYLRLVGSDQHWQGSRHFLGAASEAMRRILVEHARKKSRLKYGGGLVRVELHDASAAAGPSPEEIIVVSDLLDTFAGQYPLEAEIVKLHYFAGLNISEAGRAMGIPSSMAHRHWTFARAWLREAIQGNKTQLTEAEGRDATQ